jgi:hypothetical protein
MFSLLWQRSFSLPPASFPMTRLPAAAVAADSEAAVFTVVACTPPMSGAVDIEWLDAGMPLAVDMDIDP